MTTKTLLMFAATTLVGPVAYEGAALAGPTTAVILPGPTKDLAPTANGRLRRTDDEETTEMASIVFLKDPTTGKMTRGLYFGMRTELPPAPGTTDPRRAPDRVQGALTLFDLGQDGTGQVIATNIKQAESQFITNNNGNEYRNFNAPMAFALNDSTACVEYNYQPNNGNDTIRYSQCYDAGGAMLMDRTQVIAKNNDDCSMHQTSPVVVANVIGADHYVVAWDGCNGNGQDDGWARLSKYTQDVATKQVTVTKMFDISLAQREERSRGHCSIASADPNTAICTWTEGNNQPQRDGTWAAAIDITPGKFKGADQQGALIWKQQIDGRQDIDGTRTYSMRMAQTRILAPDATTGALLPTDKIIIYYNHEKGNNNDNRKGGTVMRTMMGVAQVNKTGLTYIMQPADTGTMMKGLGGTHLGMNAAVFGDTTAGAPLKVGAVFTNGSHTGGYFSGQARALVFDQATNKFSDGGMTPTAPSDRHLYSNYLGNNPGNQGRNHDHAVLIANPFVGSMGNTDAHLMVIASSGKPMEEVGMPEIKPSSFLTIVPVSKGCAPGSGMGCGGGNGMGSGSGSGSGSDTGSDTGSDGSPNDPSGSSLGGCSAGGDAGLAGFLLLGLGLVIRRRR